MDKWLAVSQKLVPDLMTELTSRLDLLYALSILEPVGRRTLSQHLGCSERAVRSDIAVLRQAGLLDVTSGGMVITPIGRSVLEESRELYSLLKGQQRLAESIRDAFGLVEVMVVAGDADISSATKEELGRQAGQLLLSLVKPNSVLTVSGGTTLAVLAEVLPNQRTVAELTIVPARGGLGEALEIQANTVAARLAAKLGAYYRPLYAPENLSSSTVKVLAQEPQIKEVVELVRGADLCLHGIGDAITMARRRRSTAAVLDKLQQAGAQAELFGYYLNEEAEIVHIVPSLGLHLEDLRHIDKVIAVAGGRSKASAIVAVMRLGYHTHLVIDETAATAIIDLVR